jgi:hypothetical protein
LLTPLALPSEPNLNNALAAIVSNNSNATEPATTYAFQWWADTTASQLKLRNAANDDWVVIGELDGTKLMEDGTAAAPGLAFANDLDTGLFRAAANQLGIATNGIERVEFGTSEVVFNDDGEDIDFRIEGDTEPNLFVVNAGDDTLSFGGTINSSGDVIFSATPTSSSAGAIVSSLGDAFFARAGGSGPLRLARTTSNGTQVTFYNQGSTAGSITTNSTTSTQYNTSSDYRLKENVVAVTDGITRLQQLKPSRFNFIADPDTIVDGFIAHEVQTIVPEAITGEKDAVDDDGNPEYQGIDQSKLVPLLTAALQEAIAKIETLEAKVAALEVA